MANDVTTGELDRRLRDFEARVAYDNRILHERIARVAQESVQADVHAQLEAAHAEIHKGHDSRLNKVEDRPGITLGRVMAGASVVIAILGLLLEAYSAAKGAK